jgi:F-type H+-transporting ATPase subunit gamma
MKMVAAARLRRAQMAVEEATPYAMKIRELLSSLAASVSGDVHELMGGRPVEKRILIVLSSDRGLCGAFNSQLLKAVEGDLKGGIDTIVLPIGRKARSYFARRSHQTLKGDEGFWNNCTFANTTKLIQELAQKYVKGEIDRVDVAYNEYVSVISQVARLKAILPITAEKNETADMTENSEQPENHVDFKYEPNRDEIIKALVPKKINVDFFHACLNSQASEYGARMSAMDSATRNAGEMIDLLTLKMNRARQAAITTELMEIISGSEALKE